MKLIKPPFTEFEPYSFSTKYLVATNASDDISDIIPGLTAWSNTTFTEGAYVYYNPVDNIATYPDTLQGGVYVCIKSGGITSATGVPPPDDYLNWLYIKPLNSLAMFDSVNNTSTVVTGVFDSYVELNVKLATGRTDSFGLLNVEASRIDIIVYGSDPSNYLADPLGAGASELPDILMLPWWNTDHEYIPGDIVFSGVGEVYQCQTTPPATGTAPELDPTNWSVYALDTTGIISGTTNLLGGDVDNWSDYFFSDLYSNRTMAYSMEEMARGYVQTYIHITVSGISQVSIGNFVFGIVRTIGSTEYGANTGITDYSIKETNSFGEVFLLKRSYSKRMSTNVLVETGNLGTSQRLLYDIRATPVLWAASSSKQYEEPLVIFGYYKDFSTSITYPTYSYCSLEIEGLI